VHADGNAVSVHFFVGGLEFGGTGLGPAHHVGDGERAEDQAD
jgi:hypothetical protein